MHAPARRLGVWSERGGACSANDVDVHGVVRGPILQHNMLLPRASPGFRLLRHEARPLMEGIGLHKAGGGVRGEFPSASKWSAPASCLATPGRNKAAAEARIRNPAGENLWARALQVKI